MARSRISSRRIAVGAGDQSLHVRPGWTGRESFVLEQSRGPSMPAAMLAVHHPRAAAWRKKARRAWTLVATDTTAPTALSVAGQKRIHIFQANIVERTILLAQPTQKLLYMPALTANGDRGQTALVCAGKRQSRPVGLQKVTILGLGSSKRPKNVKPLRGRLDKEFSRPLEALHTWRSCCSRAQRSAAASMTGDANSLANGDVDSLGDHQKLPSVAYQGRASQALADAMVQEPFSGFGERTERCRATTRDT